MPASGLDRLRRGARNMQADVSGVRCSDRGGPDCAWLSASRVSRVLLSEACFIDARCGCSLLFYLRIF